MTSKRAKDDLPLSLGSCDRPYNQLRLCIIGPFPYSRLFHMILHLPTVSFASFSFYSDPSLNSLSSCCPWYQHPGSLSSLVVLVQHLAVWNYWLGISLFLCCWDKTLTKTQLEEAEFIGLHFIHWGKPSRNSRKEPESKNWSKDHEETLFTSSASMASSACFLNHPGLLAHR